MSEPLKERDALAAAAVAAAEACAYGNEDDLVVLRVDCPTLPGEQDDDDVRAIAAIDVLRYLVETYEAEQYPDDADHCGHDSCAQRKECIYR